ncbi:transposase [Corynebacterium tuberculostearicum]
MVVLDGGTGAYSAICQLWPQTTIQRCLVHAQRVVRRHVTSRPRTEAGKAIYVLACDLTHVDSLDKAAQWTAKLQQFHDVYRRWMDEKTFNIYTGKREFTHIRVRRAFNSLSHLSRQQWLFAFLQPPGPPANPTYTWAATTNHLEGAICQMRVFGTGVLGTRYCRVPGSWYRAEGYVGPGR